MKSRQWLLSLAASVSIASLVIGGIHVHNLGGAPHPDFASGRQTPVARGPPPPPDVRRFPAAPAVAHAAYTPAQCGGVADEMMYWKPRAEDAALGEALRPTPLGAEERYLTFEPDVGGWNNVRMSFETMVIFAHASGRTLVLPPDQNMYLLNKGAAKSRKFGFADFYPLEGLRQAVPGFKMMTMDAFLEQETKPGGRLAECAARAPRNVRELEKKELWEWLRPCTVKPTWRPLKDCVVFGEYAAEGSAFGTKEACERFPAPDGAAEAAGGRHPYSTCEFCDGRRAWAYDANATIADAWLNHFPSAPKLGFRMFTHWYTFMHFTDKRADLFYKRIVRDYMHYLEDVFCIAGRIVGALQAEAKGAGYNAWHIRRGDLQYKVVKVEASVMRTATDDVLEAGKLTYVATDERNKTFFAPLAERYVAALVAVVLLLRLRATATASPVSTHLASLSQVPAAVPRRLQPPPPGQPEREHVRHARADDHQPRGQVRRHVVLDLHVVHHEAPRLQRQAGRLQLLLRPAPAPPRLRGLHDAPLALLPARVAPGVGGDRQAAGVMV